jgi:hypothetical protein
LISALALFPPNKVSDLSILLLAYFKRENATKNTFVLFNQFIDKFCSVKAENNHNYEFLSVYYRTLNELPRTTNSLEGYHRHLNEI